MKVKAGTWLPLFLCVAEGDTITLVVDLFSTEEGPDEEEVPGPTEEKIQVLTWLASLPKPHPSRKLF